MRKGLGRHNYRSAGGPQPSLVLDFAGTGTLDPRVTFTRSTTATYYNSSGVLSTAPINAPRFDFNPTTGESLGLLIEQSSTNLLTYSQDFTNAVWTKSNATITATANIAPDGTQTAQLLIPNTSNTTHKLIQTIYPSSTWAYTVYVKANGVNYVALNEQYQSGTSSQVLNLLTGVLTSLAGTVGTTTVTSVGNGWYRLTWSYFVDTANNGFSIVALNSNSGSANPNTYTWTGDGYSGIYIWGAQLEALAFPTSYIATTSAQVTRAADNVSMTGTNFSSWFNATQGTFYSESNSVNPLTTTDAYSIYASSGALTDFIYLDNYGTRLQAAVRSSGTFSINYITAIGAYPVNTFVKAGIYYQANNFGATYSGNTPNTTSSGNVPVGVNNLVIGASPFSGNAYLNGRIKKILYYPTALTNAQLQALTT